MINLFIFLITLTITLIVRLFFAVFFRLPNYLIKAFRDYDEPVKSVCQDAWKSSPWLTIIGGLVIAGGLSLVANPLMGKFIHERPDTNMETLMCKIYNIVEKRNERSIKMYCSTAEWMKKHPKYHKMMTRKVWYRWWVTSTPERLINKRTSISKRKSFWEQKIREKQKKIERGEMEIHYTLLDKEI